MINKKKIFTITLIILLIGIVTTSQTANAAEEPNVNQPKNLTQGTPFKDVPATDPNYIFIKYLTERALIQGYADGTYRPQAGLTRAQAASIITRAAGLAPAPGQQQYKDVPAGHWAAPSINAAAAAGYLKGYPNGTFKPEAVLTRAEGIALFMRLAQEPDTRAELPALKDITPTHWAARPIAEGLAAGMIGLTADKTQFLPQAKFTRDDLARVLAILLTEDPQLYKTTLPGQLNITKGTIILTRQGQTQQITDKITLIEGDTITSDKATEAEITYPDGSGLLIKGEAELTVKAARGRSYIQTDGQPGVSVEWLNIDLKYGKLFGALATRYDNTEQTAGINKNNLLASAAPGIANLMAAAQTTANQALPWYQMSQSKRVKVQVDMPWGVAAVRGTFWRNEVDRSGRSRTTVLTGDAEMTSGGQTVPLGAGQSTEVTSSSAPPAEPEPMPADEKQEWANAGDWAQQRAQDIQTNQETQAPPPPPPAAAPGQPGEQPAQPGQPPAQTEPQAPVGGVLETIQKAIEQIKKETQIPVRGGSSTPNVQVERVESAGVTLRFANTITAVAMYAGIPIITLNEGQTEGNYKIPIQNSETGGPVNITGINYTSGGNTIEIQSQFEPVVTYQLTVYNGELLDQIALNRNFNFQYIINAVTATADSQYVGTAQELTITVNTAAVPENTPIRADLTSESGQATTATASGTVIANQSFLKLTVPETIPAGNYRIKVQVGSGRSAVSHSLTKYTVKPGELRITTVPAYHIAGTAQKITVNIQTTGVKEGAPVTAELLAENQSPLSPAVKATGSIKDTIASLQLNAPAAAGEGSYRIKVTVGEGAAQINDSKTEYKIKSGKIIVTANPQAHTSGTVQEVAITAQTKGVQDGTAITAELVDENLKSFSPQVTVSGMLQVDKAVLKLTIPADIKAGNYKIAATVGTGTSTIKDTDTKYTVKLGELKVAASAKDQIAGTAGEVALNVELPGVKDDTKVTAELMDEKDLPLFPAVKASDKFKTNKVSFKLKIPADTPVGSYKIKVTAGNGDSAVTDNKTLYTIKSDKLIITATPTSHAGGTDQEVTVDVVTKATKDDTAVTVELVDDKNNPLSPAIKALGTIKANKAAIKLIIPAAVKAGTYRIKVTVGTGALAVTDTVTVYTIKLGTLKVTAKPITHITGKAQEVAIDVLLPGIKDQSPVTAELIDENKNPLFPAVKVDGKMVSNKASLKLQIPADAPVGNYTIKVTVMSGDTAVTDTSTAYTITSDKIAVTATPTSHVSGDKQEVTVDVTTKSIKDNTAVTVELVDDKSNPLSPAITAPGTIKSNKASIKLIIPADVKVGTYRIKVTVGTGALAVTDTVTIYTIKPGSLQVTANQTSQIAGTAQEVAVDVTLTGIKDQTLVTAELLDENKNPLIPAVKIEGKMVSNKAVLNLKIPADVPAGNYSIKVTVGTGETAVTDTSTIYTIKSDKLTVTITPTSHVSGNNQEVTVKILSKGIKDGTLVTAELVDKNKNSLPTLVITTPPGTIISNQATIKLNIPSTIPADNYYIKVVAGSGMSVVTSSETVYTIKLEQLIKGVTASPASHTAGTDQTVMVSVTTKGFPNGTPVTVALAGVSGVTGNGRITDNAAVVSLPIPNSVAAGNYNISVTVGTGTAALTDSSTPYTINPELVIDELAVVAVNVIDATHVKVIYNKKISVTSSDSYKLVYNNTAIYPKSADIETLDSKTVNIVLEGPMAANKDYHLYFDGGDTGKIAKFNIPVKQVATNPLTGQVDLSGFSLADSPAQLVTAVGGNSLTIDLPKTNKTVTLAITPVAKPSGLKDGLFNGYDIAIVGIDVHNEPIVITLTKPSGVVNPTAYHYNAATGMWEYRESFIEGENVIFATTLSKVAIAEEAEVPAELAAKNITSTSLDLTWQPVEGAKGYDVYREDINGTYDKINTSIVKQASFTDTNLEPDTTYAYMVLAYDANGFESPPSDDLVATTLSEKPENEELNQWISDMRNFISLYGMYYQNLQVEVGDGAEPTKVTVIDSNLKNQSVDNLLVAVIGKMGAMPYQIASVMEGYLGEVKIGNDTLYTYIANKLEKLNQSNTAISYFRNPSSTTFENLKSAIINKNQYEELVQVIKNIIPFDKVVTVPQVAIKGLALDSVNLNKDGSNVTIISGQSLSADQLKTQLGIPVTKELTPYNLSGTTVEFTFKGLPVDNQSPNYYNYLFELNSEIQRATVTTGGEPYHEPGESIAVFVDDPEQKGSGYVQIKAYSDTDPQGVQLTLSEDPSNPGQFSGFIKIVESQDNDSGDLRVALGDVVTFSYEDLLGTRYTQIKVLDLRVSASYEAGDKILLYGLSQNDTVKIYDSESKEHLIKELTAQQDGDLLLFQGDSFKLPLGGHVFVTVTEEGCMESGIIDLPYKEDTSDNRSAAPSEGDITINNNIGSDEIVEVDNLLKGDVALLYDDQGQIIAVPQPLTSNGAAFFDGLEIGQYAKIYVSVISKGKNESVRTEKVCGDPISDLMATAGNTWVSFTFTAPLGATSVTIEQSTDGVNWSASETESLTETSTNAIASGLSNNTTYSFRLIVTGGDHSGISNIVNATPEAATITGVAQLNDLVEPADYSGIAITARGYTDNGGEVEVTATTSSDGSFTLTGLPSGNFVLEASKAGYYATSKVVKVINPGILTLEESIILYPQVSTGYLEGYVNFIDKADHQGIVVKVQTLEGVILPDLAAMTNSQGYFKFDAIPVDGVTQKSTYIFTAFALDDSQGYATDSVQATVFANQTKTLPDKLWLRPAALDLIIFADDTTPWDTNALFSMLGELGVTYHIYSSSYMSSTPLPIESTVWIINDQPQSFYDAYRDNQDRFDNFVNQGGTLLFEACDMGWNSGSLVNTGATLPGGVVNEQLYDNINTNINPSHPMMSGVDIELQGSSASHNYFINLPSNYTILCVDNNDNPTLVEYKYGQGRVVATGQPLEAYWAWGWNGAQIYPNMIYYTFNSPISDGLTDPFFTLSSGDDTVTPTKSQNTLTYTAKVDSDVDNITITPYADKGKITVNGSQVANGTTSNSIYLNYGDNNIRVVVSEAKKLPKAYSISVVREIQGIGGIITDEANSPIAGVAVIVENDVTSYSTTTDESGYYSIILPAGTGYKVTATKRGYQPGTVTGVEVVANHLTNVNMALEKLINILQRQIDEAASGDVITIDPGYYSQLLINKSLTLKAAESGTVQIDGSDIDGLAPCPCIKIVAPEQDMPQDLNVDIEGLSLVNGSQGILVENPPSLNLTLINNTISNNSAGGVQVKAQNTLTADIQGNVIANNDCNNNSYGGGIRMMTTDESAGAIDALIKNNQITDNDGGGVRIGWWDDNSPSSNGNTIVLVDANSIANNSGGAIRVKSTNIKNASITNNQFINIENTDAAGIIRIGCASCSYDETISDYVKAVVTGNTINCGNADNNVEIGGVVRINGDAIDTEISKNEIKAGYDVGGVIRIGYADGGDKIASKVKALINYNNMNLESNKLGGAIRIYATDVIEDSQVTGNKITSLNPVGDGLNGGAIRIGLTDTKDYVSPTLSVTAEIKDNIIPSFRGGGIRVIAQDYLTTDIEGNTVEDCYGGGIRVGYFCDGGSTPIDATHNVNAIVNGNTLENNFANGIHVEGSESLTGSIEDNTVTGTLACDKEDQPYNYSGTAIYVGNCATSAFSVTGNTVTDNDQGVGLYINSEGIQLENNAIENDSIVYAYKEFDGGADLTSWEIINGEVITVNATPATVIMALDNTTATLGTQTVVTPTVEVKNSDGEPLPAAAAAGTFEMTAPGSAAEGIDYTFDAGTGVLAILPESTITGTYTISYTNLIISSVTASADVIVSSVKPMEIIAKVPTYIVGEQAEFTVSTMANGDADKLVRAYFTLPSEASIEYYEENDGSWYPLGNVYGPESGFPVADGTSKFRAIYSAAGTFTVKVEFKLTNETVLGSKDISVTVLPTGASQAASEVTFTVIGQ